MSSNEPVRMLERPGGPAGCPAWPVAKSDNPSACDPACTAGGGGSEGGAPATVAVPIPNGTLPILRITGDRGRFGSDVDGIGLISSPKFLSIASYPRFEGSPEISPAASFCRSTHDDDKLADGPNDDPE